MGKVETEMRIRRKIAIRIAVRRRLDLDDPRAQIGKQRCRVRASNERRALNDCDMVEDLYRHENLSGANVS